jgi:hypothetical protein
MVRKQCLALFDPMSGEITKYLPQRFMPSDPTKIPDLIDAYNRIATERDGIFTLMCLVDDPGPQVHSNVGGIQPDVEFERGR